MTQFVSFSQHPNDPQTILGGTQDNGSPATATSESGSNWLNVNSGDGGYNAINPNNPTEWFTANTGFERILQHHLCRDGWPRATIAHRWSHLGNSERRRWSRELARPHGCDQPRRLSCFRSRDRHLGRNRQHRLRHNHGFPRFPRVEDEQCRRIVDGLHWHCAKQPATQISNILNHPNPYDPATNDTVPPPRRHSFTRKLLHLHDGANDFEASSHVRRRSASGQRKSRAAHDTEEPALIPRLYNGSERRKGGAETPTPKPGLGPRPVGGHHKLGTFSGVFVPTCLNVLSILMFLRFGFILGQGGVLGIMGSS